MYGDATIEAPFICKKDNYCYLFVSFDQGKPKLRIERLIRIDGRLVVFRQ